MKTNKLVSIVISAVLLMTTLAGCTSKSVSNDDSSATNSGEKVKLTAIFVKHTLTKVVKEMEWLNKIQQEANVEIEWQQITAIRKDLVLCY